MRSRGCNKRLPNLSVLNKNAFLQRHVEKGIRSANPLQISKPRLFFNSFVNQIALVNISGRNTANLQSRAGRDFLVACSLYQIAINTTQVILKEPGGQLLSMPGRDYRCGALVRTCTCTTVRRHVPKVKFLLFMRYSVRLDIKKLIVCPEKHCHLAQAEKNRYASKPFDLLEIMIRMLP